MIGSCFLRHPSRAPCLPAPVWSSCALIYCWDVLLGSLFAIPLWGVTLGGSLSLVTCFQDPISSLLMCCLVLEGFLLQWLSEKRCKKERFLDLECLTVSLFYPLIDGVAGYRILGWKPYPLRILKACIDHLSLHSSMA